MFNSYWFILTFKAECLSYIIFTKNLLMKNNKKQYLSPIERKKNCTCQFPHLDALVGRA